MPLPQPTRRGLLGGLLASLVMFGRTAQTAKGQQLPNEGKDVTLSYGATASTDNGAWTYSGTVLPPGVWLDPDTPIVTMTWLFSAPGHGVIDAG